MLVLDVAHNVDGIKQLLQQIEMTGHNHLHFILGMVSDKDVSNVLTLFPKNARYYFTRAQIPRALPEEELRTIAFSKAGLDGISFPNVNMAIYNALLKAEKDDLIVVCGSIFLVGEVSHSAIKEIDLHVRNNNSDLELINKASFFD
jgi:dihydrofolate synthase/folylpolyglutamate synthase